MNDLVFFNKESKKICDNVNDFRSVWPPKVENMEILNEYLSSREFVSNKNDKISEIENDMSNFLHTKYFSFFDSGAYAIHSALIACNVTYGDEVIVPSWTFAAPAFQVLRVRAIPIFAGIKPDIVIVVGYVILYSVGIITCKLVCKIVLICPNLILYLDSFKMPVKSLLGFRFSITLNSSMKKVLLSVIRELLKFYIK